MAWRGLGAAPCSASRSRPTGSPAQRGITKLDAQQDAAVNVVLDGKLDDDGNPDPAGWCQGLACVRGRRREEGGGALRSAHKRRTNKPGQAGWRQKREENRTHMMGMGPQSCGEGGGRQGGAGSEGAAEHTAGGPPLERNTQGGGPRHSPSPPTLHCQRSRRRAAAGPGARPARAPAGGAARMQEDPRRPHSRSAGTPATCRAGSTRAP